MDTFPLNITHNGERFPIQTTNNSFIGDVKQQLSDCYNIRPVQAIHLVKQGRELFDDFMIEEYDVDETSNIILVLRPVTVPDSDTEDDDTNDDDSIISMEVDD